MPDCVLLDLMLPRYGASKSCASCKPGETARIPIIIMTGRYSDRSTSDMIRQESNVVDFMEKPIKPGVLAMTLHKLPKTAPGAAAAPKPE